MHRKRRARRLVARYLRARITLPPRKLDVFLRKLRTQLKTLGKELDRLGPRFSGRSVSQGDPRTQELIETLNYAQENLDPRALSKEDLSSLRNIFEGYGDSDIAEYFDEFAAEYGNQAAVDEMADLWEVELRDALTRAKSRRPEEIDVGTLTERAEKDLRDGISRIGDYGDVGPLRRSLDDETMPLGALLNTEGLPSEIVSVAEKVRDLVEEAGVRIEAWRQMKNLTGEPEHEDIETLYHASVNAAELGDKGFSLKMPEMGSGLGGGQLAKGGLGVSFTYDLYIAKEISRSLKEVVMLAKGQIKPSEILSWAKRGGILDLTLKNLELKDGITDVSSLQGPFETMLLYRAWLMANQMKGKRYNPLFVGDMRKLVNNLRGRSVKDVGVISAQVDMTHPGISYRAQEREYRVPPEAILSVKRII